MSTPEVTGDGDGVTTAREEPDLESQPPASNPAVAIYAGPDMGDAVAGSILRAYGHGHDVIVAYHREEVESVTFADRLGAGLVSVDPATDRNAIRQAQRRRSRAAGYPGVVYHPDPAGSLDYERSMDGLRETEAYGVDGVMVSEQRERPRLLVAIPAYNEEASIGDVVARARSHADEVVVVDDGSDDETAPRAADAGATVLEHDGNRGYGAALGTAFAAADRSRAEYLVILDGDGQHHPEAIPRLLERQQASGCEVVIGSRLVEGAETSMPIYRRGGLALVNLLMNTSLLAIDPSFGWVRDTQSGFRLYTRDAVASLAGDHRIGAGMRASTDILYVAAGEDFDIEEVGTTIRYDVDDANSEHPVRHGIELVNNIVNTIVRERPMAFLGLPGMVLLLSAIGLGWRTMAAIATTNSVPVGLASLTAVLLVAGFFLGLTATVSRAVSGERSARRSRAHRRD